MKRVLNLSHYILRLFAASSILLVQGVHLSADWGR
jgi:hypothetical protein